MSVETVIIGTAIAGWFANGWYLNKRLEAVHAKLDRIFDCFNGLREYLYEIDPQFDDERGLMQEFAEGSALFSGMNNLELVRSKQAAGKRTLTTPLL